MCDSGLLPVASLATAEDAAVVAAITAYARAEAAAAAHRLAAIAELMARRLGYNDSDPDSDAEPDSDPDPDERDYWACDRWDSAAAEIAAALTLSSRRAGTQMHLAWALHTRLPATAALLADGAITAKTAATIAWRTHLVDNPDAMTLIDATLAEHATSWGPLSDTNLDLAIDAVLEQHDPDARLAFHAATRNRNVQFGTPDDTTGTTTIYGLLTNIDAAAIDQRITTMLRGVCKDDPRTVGQRRSDALGAIAAGAEALPCRCDSPNCSAKTTPDATPVVIHVLADPHAIDAARHATDSTRAPVEAADPDPAPPAPKARRLHAAVLPGYGIIPTPLLAELLNAGATVTNLPPPSAEPEPRYRPSTRLADFVRARDLTCRFPGCTVPAARCDIDHALPYPAGPTHPCNNRCLCRKHHLLKTFWTGPSGWTDTQHPDGTIVWTSPTGLVYTTHPGCRLVFPTWNATTEKLTPAANPPVQPTNPHRGLHMPQRRRTRRQDRHQRIKNQRTQQDTS